MLIAKKIDNVLVVKEHQQMFPNTSFTTAGITGSWLADNDCYPVSAFKEYDAEKQKLESCQPYLENGTVYTVKVTNKTAEELQKELVDKQEFVCKNVSQQLQFALDSYAVKSGYDSILAMCSYISSNNPKFSTEAATALELRDTAWQTLLSLFEQFKSDKIVLQNLNDVKNHFDQKLF